MAALRLFLKFCDLTRLHKGKLLAASSFGLFAANLSQHVLPEQTFRKLYQAWSKGEPAPLSDELHALFQDVLSEARCGSPDGYTPFAGYGFHPVSAGVPWLPGGCSVGIPANYNADGVAGIADRMLVINGEEVDWRSDAGGKLRDALTLSRDAQKFSLAREAVHARGGGPVIQAAVGPACLVAVCVTSVGMKQLLGLYAGPMLLRGAFNLLAVTLGFTAYLMCDDSVNHWLDYRADRRAATVSESYARGGMEFYEKILARNRVLRGLIGARGEATYAPNGNLFPRHKLRLKHAPYTCRKERIRQALEAGHS